MFVVDQNFQKHCQAGQHLKPWSNREEISINSQSLIITIDQQQTWHEQLIFAQRVVPVIHLLTFERDPS